MALADSGGCETVASLQPFLLGADLLLKLVKSGHLKNCHHTITPFTGSLAISPLPIKPRTLACRISALLIAPGPKAGFRFQVYFLSCTRDCSLTSAVPKTQGHQRACQ